VLFTRKSHNEIIYFELDACNKRWSSRGCCVKHSERWNFGIILYFASDENRDLSEPVRFVGSRQFDIIMLFGTVSFLNFMLSAKRTSDGQTVHAYFESKTNAPYVCLVCDDEVVLKTGKLRINYFAHINPLTCHFGKSESETHRRCKMEIYEALLQMPNVQNVALERPLDTVRPDVSAYINGFPVAIEVQISSLSIETIMRRTIDYHRKGIYVLWLLQWTPALDAARYAPKPWEKWIHAAYFGRVYYWTGGLNVVSYQFEPSFKTIPQKSWYAKDGRKITGGGYSVRSKRFKAAIRGKTLNLATDFGPKERSWWGTGDVKVPDAKLFMEQ
jgi:competence protein CoiA